MNFKQTLEEIDRIIKQTPFTKEEIATFWQAEKEDWTPETIFALAAAYEYTHKRDNRPEAEFLRGKYLHALDDLKERYSERPQVRPTLM